jgi:hypothetical protein
MRSKSILSVSILLVVLLVSSDASAGRYWFYSPVEGPDDMPLGGGNSAIGMRSGNTWPVVAYSEGQYGDGGAAAMMPGYWLQGPVGFYGPVVINGATAPDGTVGFADNHGGVVTFGQNGWGSGSYNGDACYRASMSFNNAVQRGIRVCWRTGMKALSTLTVMHWILILTIRLMLFLLKTVILFLAPKA